MRRRLTLMTHVALWLAEIATFQALALVASLLGGTFTYMGGADLSSLRIAVDNYGGSIAKLIGNLFLWDAGILALLALPFTPWFLRWMRGRVVFALLRGAALLFAIRATAIAIAAIRIPTLFADIYHGDGTSATAHLMGFICSPAGIVALIVLWLGIFALMQRRTGWAATGAAFGTLAAGGAVVAYLEMRPVTVTLPAGSVVVYLADSLRADAARAETMPRLWQRMQQKTAILVPHVVPPQARTAPAVVALFTGLLPEENGVTTMFSASSTFDQVSRSIATRFKKKGYCTVAAGEYPAEMLRKIDLGFEINFTPLVRFREIALQLILAKDPFALAALSFQVGRDVIWEEERNLVRGLPTFADTRSLHRRFARAVSKCGDRPVFGFIFGDQPHFPYVQTWPHYLALGDYSGRYRWSKDAVSTPASDADRARIRELYRASTLAADEGMAAFVDLLERSGSLDGSLVVFSGDHGESLYDGLGIMGHGDQLGEAEGIEVPWIAFGKGRERFVLGTRPVQSTRMAPLLLRAGGDKNAPKVVTIQTGEWLADTPNVPAQRIRYPELSDLLRIQKPDAHIEIRPEYERIVEYAKHRTFLLDEDRYDVIPESDQVTWKKNRRVIASDQVPDEIKAFLREHDAEIAPLLLH